MSYTELESGYQGLQHSRPGFYVGEDGNLISIDRADLDLDPSDGIDSDGSVSSNSGKQVIVGICAMSKKSSSKPMKEILMRLQEFEFIKIVVFPEEVILKEPVEQWPICDCLISFHSKGFPLDKAIQYATLRKPYVINNLHMQYDIQDRRKVYSILESEGIEIPRYAVLDRDSPDPKQHELVESEDHVEVNGVIFNKPFVEKPVSAEDHNIYIYYPTSAGGGSQRLFRKIGSRSSVYSPESRVRKTGSFIYEDFMPTDGTDVKVYTVGPDYAHAEARKSPALDGKVERDSEGKEIRYPVILSNAEKLISRKVCLAFKQTVCGFDLLRANGKSYVCDVNGFSFVKNSNKYYDDSAKILGNMILRELAPTLHIPWSVPFQLDDPPIVPTTFGKMMELRCVVAIIRHGDRTPKQKMKVEVRHQKFFEIFEKYEGYKHGHIKLKRPKQLQEILDVTRSLLSDIQIKAADPEIEEKQGKLEQLKSVLEMYGHFSGINRKVQMKYQPKGRPRGSSSDDGNISSNGPKDPSLVLILKWGGELTPAGRIQAEELGRIFRCMYPGGQGRNEYAGAQGLGLLRLHSTFRHDLKIYASDEGRVQMTAAAFAKGLLALEGELTPILVQMVKSANTNGLLDNDCDSSKYQNMAKNRLHDLMQIDRDFSTQDRDAINPCNSISINQALDFVKNPVKCCAHVHSLIQSLLAVIAVKRDDQKTRDAILYHGETWELMGRRWGKIEKDFSTKSKTFDISKIPDIYDCIKYDLQHNQHTLQFEQAEELYIYAKYLADIVIPQEYGLNVQEKLTIGQGICTPLLKKIKADLQRNIEEVGEENVNRLNPRYSHGVSSPGRHVRTRLYFTSESHVHSLLTVLRYGGLANIMTDEQWRRAMEYVSMVSELNYMSQIVIMLYEDPTKDPSSEERFHVELHFSPGVNCCVQKNLPPGPGFRPHSRNDSGTSKNNSGEDEPASTRIEEEGEMSFDDEFGPISTTIRAASESPKSPPDDQSPSEFIPITQKPSSRSRTNKSSNPISIGSHHTVSGHEAMDLAKRLNEELAAQMRPQLVGSYGSQRAVSPDSEPRARSFEHRQHHHHHHHHHHKTKDQIILTPHATPPLTPVPPSITPPNRLSPPVSLFVAPTATTTITSASETTSTIVSVAGFNSTPTPPPMAVEKPYVKPKLIRGTVSATNELPLSAITFESNPLSPIVYEPLDISLITVDDRPLISPLATNERPLSCTCLAVEPPLIEQPKFMSTVTAAADDDLFADNFSTVSDPMDIVPKIPRLHLHSLSLYTYDATPVPAYCFEHERQTVSAPPSIACSPQLSPVEQLIDENKLKIFGEIAIDESEIDSLDRPSSLSSSSLTSLLLNNISNLNNNPNDNQLMITDDTNEMLPPFGFSHDHNNDDNCNKNNNHNNNDDDDDGEAVERKTKITPINFEQSMSCNTSISISSTTTTSALSTITTASASSNILAKPENFVSTTITITTATDTITSPPSPTNVFETKTSSTTTIICANLNNPTNIPHTKLVKLNNPDSSSSPTTTTTTTSHHHNNVSSSSSTTSSSAVRRQRHSIAGQMNYFKLLGFGGFNKKMTTSANSLFSTAVISGSSSAPNLRDMIPNTITSPSVLEGFGGVPPIRPLETLHNALSLKQIDAFLEKMTTALLFKTPASSPPKNPSTPVPTPTQTPQNSLPRSAAHSSWSGQSSMTSSTSALSSAGPSSPNISEVLSRGCPSSDMSASLISNDGNMGVLGATSGISQMFPVLDYDLSTVGGQLTIDQIDEPVSSSHLNVTGTSGDCPSLAHGSGDTTPISISSDWEFNTNDATKGSTTNELYTEEEEEERTLSTDTCLSTPCDLQIDEMSGMMSSQQFDSINSEFNANKNLSKTTFQNVTTTTDGSITTQQSLNVDSLKNSIKNFEEILLSSSGSSPVVCDVAATTPKIDNKFRNSRIQKQISLYEKESSSAHEYKNLSNEVAKFNETPSNVKLASRRRIGTVDAPTIISAEDLEKSITNLEKNLNTFAIDGAKDKCTKTKSCVNLKTIASATPLTAGGVNSSTPGAVLVKESFIENPPKRVARSFHGTTERRSSELPTGSSGIHGPSSSGGATPKLTNLNQLQRQYSVPNSSYSIYPSTSAYSMAGPSGLGCPSSSSNQSTRFKTTLVREFIPSQSVDVEALDNVCSLTDEKNVNAQTRRKSDE